MNTELVYPNLLDQRNENRKTKADFQWFLFDLNLQSSVTMILELLQAAFAVFVLHLVRNALQPGLTRIPGPFLAKFTDIWRLFKLWQWTFKEDLPDLHRKYNSTLIRVGPRTLSCSDPRAVELIYGFHTEFKKVSTDCLLRREAICRSCRD